METDTNVKENFKPKIVSKTKEEFDELHNFVYDLPDEVFGQIQRVEKDMSGNIFCHLKNLSKSSPTIYLPKKVYAITNHANSIIIICDGFYIRVDGEECNGSISYRFNRHNKKSEEEMKRAQY